MTNDIERWAQDLMVRHAAEWERDCKRWHGRILTGRYKHWCPDWDELPIDETCSEMECCTCQTQADQQ